jgi:hypothetical protein
MFLGNLTFSSECGIWCQKAAKSKMLFRLFWAHASRFVSITGYCRAHRV